MRHWISATAALMLAAPAGAQSSAGVSIWLQLPMSTKLAGPGRVQSGDERIFDLLSPDAASVTIVAEKGPLVHYTADKWSDAVAPEKRREMLSTLSKVWGPALHVDEASASATPSIERLPATKGPTLDSALGLVPSSLLDGDHAGFYDGARSVPGHAGEVHAQSSAEFSRSLSARPPAPKNSAKPEAPSPSAEPYADLIQTAAHAAGLDPALLRAVVVAKSRYRSDRASSGAYGLMGISARNAKAYGYTTQQILDPEINLKVGSEMLADLLRQFGGDVPRALAAYQAGPRKVLDSDGIPNDRDVKDFMGAVEVALGPRSRAAQVPVKPIRSPIKYGAQKDMIELAEQARKGSEVSRYRPLIEKVADQFGVDPRLMEAMVMQEDPSGNPEAVSPKGAEGLAQFMPKTAVDMGVENTFDPAQSLRGMAKYIKTLSDRRGIHGDPVLIAAAYNSGMRTVERVGRVPRLPETMAYVRRVFNNYSLLTDKKIDVEPYMPPARSRGGAAQ
ncbi:MAG: lytic transglycosylase domain-containing protein [Elusimicrobiota bacterium]